MSELTIEPADTGLADEFPQLVYDTNPGLWDYVWGDAPDEFQTTLSSAFKEQRGIFSHALTRVAQLNGEPVGICLCYTADQKKDEFPFTLDYCSRALSEKRWAVVGERIGLASYLSPEIPGDALFILLLSLMPAARGKGVGGTLLEDAADKAKALGKSCLVLDVYITNLAARFYARKGFRTIIETRLPDLEAQGVLPIHRMMKQI